MKTTKATRKSVTIAWSKPVYNGGDDITSYVVEFAHVKKDGEDPEIGDWTKGSKPVQYLSTEYTLGDLVENEKYKIR